MISALLISNVITKPLLQLRNAMMAAPSSQFNSYFTHKQNDVVGDLARSYNGMGERPGSTGAAHYNPVINSEEDLEKLVVPRHRIDKAKTMLLYEKINDAIGDLVPIDVNRGPELLTWTGDISTDLCKLHGLEQMLWSFYDEPDMLHRMIKFMADGIEKVQKEAEDAGDFGATNSYNQSMPYAPETVRPQTNVYGLKRNQLWCFLSAQEFTMSLEDAKEKPER